MNKEMMVTIVVLVWLTVIIGGLTIYIPKERDDHIKKMGRACTTQVHNLFVSANSKITDVYGVLAYKDAFTLENDAKKDCLLQYPLR